MNLGLQLFSIAFPLKFRHIKKPQRNGWITKGMKISIKKMRGLNMLKKQSDLTEGVKNYITKYQIIYRKVIREEKGGMTIRIYCMQITNLKLCGRL